MSNLRIAPLSILYGEHGFLVDAQSEITLSAATS